MRLLYVNNYSTRNDAEIFTGVGANDECTRALKEQKTLHNMRMFCQARPPVRNTHTSAILTREQLSATTFPVSKLLISEQMVNEYRFVVVPILTQF